MSSLSNYPDRRAVVGALAAVPVLPSLFGLFGPTPARAQTQMTSAGKGFSFAVYGDSRPMMYLPSKEGNPDLNQLFVEMFGLVMPEKVAAGGGEEGREDDLRSGTPKNSSRLSCRS